MSDPLRTISAVVCYDGTGFHGFQVQVGVPTVQGTLEAALDACTERQARVTGAGRTDAGVHAVGQVVATTVRWRHSLVDLQRAWNANLPTAVSVRTVRAVPPEFHPRFSALSRTYRYTVWHAEPVEGRATPQHSPLTDRYGWLVVRSLDVVAMQAAAAALVGRHDFASFGQPPQGERTERTVYTARWFEVTESLPALQWYPGRRLVFEITADGFLRQMVRSLVGSLLAVGQGMWSVAEMAAALAACDRSRSAPPAPPQGLVLEKVAYPPAWDALVYGELKL